MEVQKVKIAERVVGAQCNLTKSLEYLLTDIYDVQEQVDCLVTKDLKAQSRHSVLPFAVCQGSENGKEIQQALSSFSHEWRTIMRNGSKSVIE